MCLPTNLVSSRTPVTKSKEELGFDFHVSY